MNTLILIILFIICSSLIINGFLYREKIYEYPFMAALVFLVFFVWPSISLLSNDMLPENGVTIFLLMSVLSLSAIYLGNRYAKKYQKSIIIKQVIVYNSKRWLVAASFLIFIGFYGYWKQKTSIASGASAISGDATKWGILVFFLRYGTIMLFFSFIKKPSIINGVLLVPGIYYYFDFIVMRGRRQSVIELCFLILISLFFVKKIKVSRSIFIVSLIMILMFFFSIKVYRNVLVEMGGSYEWSKVENIDFTEAFTQNFTTGNSETRYAVYLCSAISILGNYDFGAFQWNHLVHNYIPAQYLGKEFKESLLIDNGLSDTTWSLYEVNTKRGTTASGMVDAFGSFWYFGWIKFFIIAFCMGYFYNIARHGDIKWQVIYCYMMTMALHSITHHTAWFFTPFVMVFIFWIPLLNFCREKEMDKIATNKINKIKNSIGE